MKYEGLAPASRSNAMEYGGVWSVVYNRWYVIGGVPFAFTLNRATLPAFSSAPSGSFDIDTSSDLIGLSEAGFRPPPQPEMKIKNK